MSVYNEIRQIIDSVSFENKLILNFWNIDMKTCAYNPCSIGYPIPQFGITGLNLGDNFVSRLLRKITLYVLQCI